MSLFSQIKKANAFGKTARSYLGVSDAELMRMYRNGDANALAEFANRHPDMIAGETWRRTSRLNSEPEAELGDVWLSLDKTARNFDPNAGAQPTTMFTNNARWKTGEDISKKATDNERYANYDNVVTENGESGADILSDKPMDIGAKEAELKEMKDMVAKLEKELANIKVGEGTGTDVIDAYKVADYNNAGKDVEKFNEGAKRFDEGKDASFQESYKKPSVVTDKDMADQLGLGRETFVARKKSMLDKLPPKLREEILMKLRGRK